MGVLLVGGIIGVSWAMNAPQASSPPQSNRSGEIVKQPLKDLNIIQDEIPAVLLDAKSAPYAKSQEATCESLTTEIEDLDVALGRDLDLDQEADDSMSKKISDETFNLARGAISGLIPYRGILRRVTGAEKHARAINEALLAGAVRRSYLKGFGESLGCAYPAAPRRAEKSDEQSP
jgi:hypothetical protein